MDLEFIEQVEAPQVLKCWQQTLPPGLVLMEAYEVPVSGKSLSQQLESARWSFELTSQAGDPSISLEQWQLGHLSDDEGEKCFLHLPV